MPQYSYICDNCIRGFIIIKSMSQSQEEFCPKCGKIARRNYRADLPNSGNKDYAKLFVSEALGIHPDEAVEHKRRYPNVEVLPEGQLGFHNVSDHKEHLKAIGWDKRPAKKRKAKKILSGS